MTRKHQHNKKHYIGVTQWLVRTALGIVLLYVISSYLVALTGHLFLIWPAHSYNTVNTTHPPAELLDVWCELTGEIYLPDYCRDDVGGVVSPCMLEADYLFLVVVTARFEWTTDHHYYSYYLPYHQNVSTMFNNIHTGNYRCEVNSNDLTETYPRGLLDDTLVWTMN